MTMILLALLVLGAAISLGDARQNVLIPPRHGATMITGGEDALPGEFPWQMALQRLREGVWEYSCGGVLLSNLRVLSAARCVFGATASELRVVAGQYDRTSTEGTQISNVLRYVVHENFNVGNATFANDIAIVHLTTSISTGPTIQYSRLPANNDNNYAGATCVGSGWGGTSNNLQKASFVVQSFIQCSQQLDNFAVGQVCVIDQAEYACNGDIGSPLNCAAEGAETVVAGIGSFARGEGGHCIPSFPSVYTRTSDYLVWIGSH